MCFRLEREGWKEPVESWEVASGAREEGGGGGEEGEEGEEGVWSEGAC